MSPNAYMQHLGRVGGFGAKGLVISSICSEADVEVLQDVFSLFEVAMSSLSGSIDWRRT